MPRPQRDAYAKKTKGVAQFLPLIGRLSIWAVSMAVPIVASTLSSCATDSVTVVCAAVVLAREQPGDATAERYQGGAFTLAEQIPNPAPLPRRSRGMRR